ncbi:hypothetical protein EN828_27170 [Mesorhizobium sp. M2D.F.Ca.ET.185.01.1.1]|uniref:SdrD B-like domain-containing protein n=1 Tax=unclassified Mesorhizobium TaxID=325217 RepID=UPI000FCC5F47|nr:MULTISPECIES: SdrD B-like domain-containing protein [unclassified Mesorhizobium]TGP74764.1 hypothetical protein EN870_26200 [bacterium M00.F.Ca.ET.227.01.1.1]TGP84659.1 hypothetical protein EN864_29005 [bacterium M00.F.Ca.ET.221.01.1.1]TGP87718.1 hypothetical protein EN865_28305 [bacterium M00.F.Ca.ET.222.01.1.1]TGT97130.1 hypothetical protein EN806_50165 [bacterium M00.F.Ca.ET.163.01.1.1]TGU21765.1 hypothetical protein EN799_53070 [bacterium M00.F.Ca.ET.156.01.1.1]TGU42829.1 hypothetical 
MKRGLLFSGVVAAAIGLAMGGGAARAGDASDYYPKRVWGSFENGQMNTSLLVFRDLNRNGVYDMGDRPMSRAAVELDKPNGSTVMRLTNAGGFANFRMSVSQRDFEVVDPGHYAFRVVPPPGYSVTTGNAWQESDYVVSPGSPGDMIATRTTHPVGLAADLTISGAAAGSRVSLTGPDGVASAAKVGPDGRFSTPVTPGEWLVDFSAGGATGRRHVVVGAAPVVLSAFSGKPAEAPLPVAHVVGFDDLMTSPGVFEVPSGYGGLNWYNLVAMHQRFTDGPGYVNTTMSGEFIAYNSSGHPAQVFSDKPFDFTGAYFGAGWDDAEGETLILKAWRGDEPAYEDHLTLSANGLVYFAADYRRITRLEIRTQHYWQAAIDDFAYRTGP